jgi:hypothetical protein
MPLIEHKTEVFGDAAVRVTWPGVKSGDTTVATYWSRHSDRSLQIVGVFGGATVHIYGSNDGENFVPLTDMRGNNLTFAAPRLDQVEDCSFAIKPVVTGGDGTTLLDIIMFARKGT